MKSAVNFFQCIIVCLILSSCTKDPQDIETVQLTDDLYIEVTDTIAPLYVVYRLDSFATSGSNMAIIGGVTDPNFGRIESQTYCRFKLATNTDETIGAANTYYDSIVLVMHSDSSFYGDTLSSWTVQTHQLLQEFDASTTYYNHHSMLASGDEVGNASVRFRPNIDDSIRIRLSDEWGSELFGLYKKNDSRVQTEEEFQRYFKGLEITSASSNQAIYRFSASDSTLFIRLYYHEDKGTGISKYLDFPAEGGTFQFNNITCDPSSSELHDLDPGDEIRSEQLDNRIYVNDLAGIGTKMTFPSVPSVATLPNFIRLEDGLLHLRPINYSFSSFPLIPYLGMNLSNETGSSSTPLYTSDNSSIQTGNLYIDLLTGEKTGYTYDVSALMRTEISATPVTSNTAYLKAYSSSQGNSFSMNRLVAADNRHSQTPSTLQTQLIFYKK